MLLRQLLLYVCLFGISTSATATTAVNKAAKTFKTSLTANIQEHSDLWVRYFLLDRLADQKKIDVNTRDTIACRLNQTASRPEYQAPVPSLKGFAELARAIDEIKFTAAEIKAAKPSLNSSSFVHASTEL